MDKPSLPSGTRDFGPLAMMRRKYIIGILENTFKLHGFLPIETPALENLRTLQGKYGDEGDQLLFKVLNSGDYLTKADPVLLSEKDSKKLTPLIADRGLRYDLTVPMARFVVMNRNDISFPFRRYQIQPVWRADRPQKGRYREFWQCDCDVIGTNSVTSEADLAAIYSKAFRALQLPVIIRINHRKLFDALRNIAPEPGAIAIFMQCMDKADKTGVEAVKADIASRPAIAPLAAVWDLIAAIPNTLTWKEKIDRFGSISGINEDLFQEAKNELTTVFEIISAIGNISNVVLDLTLARGLNYYTGSVFEVVLDQNKLSVPFSMGSIGGGGRYANLTEVFGLKDVSGVGISFGLDRIYDCLEGLNLFPQETEKASHIIFCGMDDESIKYAFPIAEKLRENAIPCEIYPSPIKLGKQLDYANTRKIPFAAIIGESERTKNMVTLKNLFTGTQEQVLIHQLPQLLK